MFDTDLRMVEVISKCHVLLQGMCVQSDHHRCCRIASWPKQPFSLQTCPSGIPRKFSDQKKRKWTMEPPKLVGLYRCVSFSKAIFSKFGGVWKMNILFPKGWFSGSFRRSFLGGEAEVGKPTNPQPGAKGGGSIARVSGSFLAARKTWGVFHKERFLGGTFVPGKLRQKREVVVNFWGSVQWE